MNEIFEILRELSLIEWLGFGFNIIQVVLAKQNKAINYLFGIIGVILSIYILFQSKLYAEIALYSYYLVMSIYGWLYWKYGKQKADVAITFATFREKGISFVIMCLGYIVLYITLITFTDSDVPHLDALVSATAWAGMWLMAKRKVENWILLNISNIVAIFLFWYKGVYLYSVLSLILFIVAVFGYINWKKIVLERKA